MAWAIIPTHTSKCAQKNPQQLPKTSKFYSRCKKCDIEKTLGEGGYHPLCSPKVKVIFLDFHIVIILISMTLHRFSGMSLFQFSLYIQGHVCGLLADIAQTTLTS